MDKVYLIVKILITVLTFLVTSFVPAIIVFVKKQKALKEAKSEAEREKIINEMKEDAQKFIVEAEDTYKTFDSILKSNGSTAGAVKKEIVMSKLRVDAINRGIEFVEELWSETVDKIVAMTKSVN